VPYICGCIKYNHYICIMNIYLVTEVNGGLRVYSNLKKVSAKESVNYHRAARAIRSKGFWSDGLLMVSKHFVR
jgi:hypothetical protein